MNLSILKKLTTILLIFTLALTISACDKINFKFNSDNNETQNNEQDAEETTPAKEVP